MGSSGLSVTPDGVRYVAASEKRAPRPFHYRWLIPKLCRNYVRRWEMVTRASLGACQALVFFYVGGWRGVAAAGAMLGLAGIVKFNWKHPVLVDAPAMACALGAAVAFQHGVWSLGIACAVLGGCVRETSPIFAALYAWNPLALVGLFPVAVRHLQREGPDVLDEENRWILDHPFKASRKYHAHFPVAAFVLPWGAGLLALAHPTPQLALVVAVAYAQCLVATDTVRLYQWAWPVVLLNATHAVSLRWLPLLVVLTIANPFASEGT